MKPFKTFLGVLLIVSFFSECLAKFDLFDNLEKKLIYYNLVGVASNGTSILVWGNTGEVLRSINQGKEWERIIISNDYYQFIVGIESIGKKYVGVLNQNYGIVSTDDGKTWQMKNINGDQPIYKMSVYNNQIFLMSENRFKVFDENFNLVKELNYTKDTNYYEFVVTNNTIVFPSANGKIKLINIENSQETVLDLKSAGLCTECLMPTNFLTDKDNFYFLLEDNYFRYSFSTKSFSLFGRPMKTKGAAFTLWNSKLFQIYSIYSSGLDSLFFYQLSPSRQKINIGSFDRRVIESEFTSLRFIDNNLVIGVGRKKLICISSNGGQTWSVISFVNIRINPGSLFIFDTLNLRVVDEYHNFYYTTNGGTTWLPTRIFPEKILKVNSFPYQFHYFFDTLNGVSVYSKKLTPDSNIIYTTDKGETIKLEYSNEFNYLADSYSTLPEDNKLLVFTNNVMASYGIWFIVWEVGKNFEFNKKSYSLYRQISSPVIANNQIVAPSVSLPPGKTFEDSLASFWIIKSSNWGLTWDSLLVPNVLGNGYFPSLAPDYFGAWAFDGNVYITFHYSNLKQSQSFLLLYHYDPITDDLTLLDTINEGLSPVAMFKFQNKYYLLKNRFAYPKPIFKLNIFDEPKTVREVDLSSERIYPVGFVRSFVDPTLIVVNIWDTLRYQYSFVYLMKDETYSDVEDNRLNARYYTTHFYATEPYPLPAHNIVKNKIYWDGSFDLHEALDGVYDSMGRKVEGKERISIVVRNRAWAEMEWECTGVPSGVYFILFRWAGGSEVVPVVVQ